MSKRISKGQRTHLIGAARSMNSAWPPPHHTPPWVLSVYISAPPVFPLSWEEEQADFFARHTLSYGVAVQRERGKVL